MSTKTTTTAVAKQIANLKAGIASLRDLSTEDGAVTKENVQEFSNLVDDLVADLKAVKEPHKRALAVVVSSKSRAARKERLAAQLARLAELEAKEGAAAE